MRLRRHSQQDEPQVDLTPMLDIVFIMLIFFIVSTSFIRPSGIDVEPPVAASARPQTSATVEVGIDADGQLHVAGQQVEAERLAIHVERLLSRQPGQSVLIRADAKVAHGVVIDALDRLRLGGIEQVALAAEPGP